MLLFRSKKQIKKLKNHFPDDYDFFINLWKKRFLRVFVGQETPDFQTHLINVMLDKFDLEVRKKYSDEVFEDFCLFLSEIDELKLFEELKMLKYVEEVAGDIDSYATKKGISFQEGIYNYLMENIDI